MKRIFVVGARGIPDVEGGAEKNAERLFPRIAERGWPVLLAGLSQNIKGSDFRGVSLWGAPNTRFLKTDKLGYYVAAIFRALRYRPDIVHFQGLGSALFLWVYKLMGAKTVVRYGSADYLVDKWGFIGRSGFLAAEYQLRWADAVISVTPALADRLKERGIEGNVHVIANATDSPEDFGNKGEHVVDQPYVLAVGRVTAQKNVHRLIEGFKIFADRNPGVKLAIAGGIDNPDYMEKVNPLLDERIVMLGRLPRSTMGDLYANAHIYINASIHEGSSNAVLEAISWRCPILLSAIPENRDFNIDDKHYFDEKDPAAIADALERAHADKEGYRVSSDKFMTWDDVADRTDAIYRSFFAEKGKA